MRTERNKTQEFEAVGRRSSTEPGLRGRHAHGFSLVELLVVMAVLLIVGAIAMPTVATTMDAYRLRGSLTNISGLTQRCRLLALKKNSTSHLFVDTSTGSVILYCKEINDPTTSRTVSDPQVQLPTQFSAPGLPTGGPTQLTASLMWGSSGSTFNVDSDPYFNSRGLPCNAVSAGSPCTSVTGYVYYFKYTGTKVRWTAISISPASRLQSWFWNGGSWGN